MLKNWSYIRVISYQVNLFLFFLCAVGIAFGWTSFGLRDKSCSISVTTGFPPIDAQAKKLCGSIFEQSDADNTADQTDKLLTHGILWRIILSYCIFTSIIFLMSLMNIFLSLFDKGILFTTFGSMFGCVLGVAGIATAIAYNIEQYSNAGQTLENKQEGILKVALLLLGLDQPSYQFFETYAQVLNIYSIWNTSNLPLTIVIFILQATYCALQMKVKVDMRKEEGKNIKVSEVFALDK